MMTFSVQNAGARRPVRTVEQGPEPHSPVVAVGSVPDRSGCAQIRWASRGCADQDESPHPFWPI